LLSEGSFPEMKEESSFHVQLQMSDTLSVEKLTLLAGAGIAKCLLRTIIVPHIAPCH